MHRALAIPEILRTILGFFIHEPIYNIDADKEYYYAVKASRPSVLNMALTCRSFREPALDSLWWAMEDLVPLFNLLPGFESNQELAFFGSPHLRACQAQRSPNTNGEHIQSLLDLLPHTSPRIVALFIRFSMREQCVHAVRRMPELLFLIMDSENVELRLSLGPDFLTNFASRQTLRQWFLRGNFRIAPLPTSSFHVLDFDKLTCLSFVSKMMTSIAEYTPLFRVARFPSLEQLQVCLAVDHIPGQSLSPIKIWRDFFKYLRCATTNSFWRMDVTIRGPTACQVPFDDIPDLHTFTSLESFETNIFHSLSHGNLTSLFAHWPRLNILSIDGVEKVTIDFSSLVDIAKGYPHLNDLEIEVICKTLPRIDDVPVLEHGLKTLKLSPLRLKNHIALARCIDRIFPKLVQLTISGSDQFLKSGTGKEIQEIYAGLQSARKDQMKREGISR
ncbi:hypothetical protein M413DRAFT_443329, partial [Hebeloma cylindrosporum]